MTEQDYINYNSWKSWSKDSFFRFSDHEDRYFSADFEGVSLPRAKILDIGFGNGALLSWAKNRGADVYGIEILQTSLERAREKNIPLLSSELGDNLPKFVNFFDVIVAYDVLEHLNLSEIIRALDASAQMLKPGGMLMLRFPNGQSPFGRFLQHADHTHRSTLSLAILDQLTASGPLLITRHQSKRIALAGRLPHRVGARIKSLLRAMTEWYLRTIFDLNCDLGPNVVVRLTKLV
jgi:2-polyprenyl-3-methyl-5-hydroxy-6-metoxy-1,4-benzoquinol methylase